MFEDLVPIYREKELYTLFYDQKKGIIYKYQHRKKSKFNFYLLILLIIWLAGPLASVFENINNPIINCAIILISIIMTYDISKRFYKAYYIQSTRREMIVNQSKLKERALNGLKQLKIEFIAALVSLMVCLYCFILFFTLSSIRSMIVACIALAVVFIFCLMKPISRKTILNQFINE